MLDSRLFQIVYYLLQRGHATAPELAKRFEVSVRTIYRDLDALSAAGLPVYTEPGRKGGIRFLEGFVLSKSLLTEQEKGEIMIALKSLAVTGYPSGDTALTKLEALFQTPGEDWLEVDFSRWGRENQDRMKFQILKSAILNREELEFEYSGSNGGSGIRLVRPARLLYKSKGWYLKAFCTARQDYRTFKLNRIQSPVRTGRQFEPLECPGERQTQDGGDYTRLVLRFPARMAYRVYDEFEADEVEPQTDESLIVTVSMPEDPWLTGYLLSFGSQVTVVEPVRLREVLAKAAREILLVNEGPGEIDGKGNFG